MINNMLKDKNQENKPSEPVSKIVVDDFPQPSESNLVTLREDEMSFMQQQSLQNSIQNSIDLTTEGVKTMRSPKASPFETKINFD